MANTRDTLYRRMVRRIRTVAAREGGGRPKEGQRSAHRELAEAGQREGYDFSLDKVHTPDLENIGPARQIISRMPTKPQRRLRKAAELIDKGFIFLSRLYATAWELRPWREKTAIELAKIEEEKKRAKIRRILRKEAAIFARRAANAYDRMGLSYTPPLHQRSFLNGKKKVVFSNIVAERNAIWMQIDTTRLPYGVDILKLVDDPNILTNVSSSLRHHIEGVYDVERGAWLCIERGRGVRGIPQLVTYEKMMELRPEKSTSMTIPLGETVNSKRIYRNLRDFPHMLVGGSTGQGKTSYLNVILAALIENNTPDQLRLVLVDLKNGIEFDMYKGVPHLWKMGGKDKPEKDQIAPDGIVGRVERVIPLLNRLRWEGERRLALFKKAQVSNIDEYNKGRKKTRLDRIVIVFDEWARVALIPKTGVQADRVLAEITATYRAVGFHVILATQTPLVRVISTLIKTNFNARLAFGVPHNTASMVILDSGRARGLSPVGRAIFQFGVMEVETQVPLITKNEIKAILDEARADGGAVEDEVTLLEICKYSLQHLNGSLAGRPIHEQYQHKISYKILGEKLASLDGMLLDIEGVEYVVKPGNGGSIPRTIEPYKEQGQDGETDPVPPAIVRVPN